MSRLVFGPFVLDLAEKQLLRDGRACDMQPLVFTLLAYGAQRPGHLLERDDLVRLLWPDVNVTAHSLTQTVHRLRDHLGEHREWWATVPKRGFRFDAPVVPEDLPLPTGPDAFFGRTDELATLAGMWNEGSRWVSVVGPGGAGKTRLALEHVHRRQHPFPWSTHVDLAGTSVAEGIAGAVASALGGIVSGREDPIAQVGRALAHRGAGLVVVDNLEQLLPAARGPLEALAQAAPDVRWLATSRTRPGVEGERLFELPPLPTLDGRRLFMSRARHAGALLVDEDPEVDAIVDALDGNALAIELAAARAPLLPTGDIRVRLDEQLRLLSGRRAGPERHRSLHAAVEWSWKLLQPWEQRVLAHVALFVGGFTVAMAERVADPGPDGPAVLDVLQTLRDQSLLQRHAAQARPEAGRLRLAVAVRTFAHLHVPDADPDGSVRERFVGLMTERAEEAERLVFDWDAARSREAAADLDSSLAALRLAQDASAAVRLAVPLARWLDVVGRAAEAKPFLEPLHDASLPPSLAGRLVVAERSIAHHDGSAKQRGPEEIERHATAAEARGEYVLASDLWAVGGFEARLAARYAEARAFHERGVEAARLADDLGRLPRQFGAAATAALFAGDGAAAEALALQGLAACRGDRYPQARAELYSAKGYTAGWAGRGDEAVADLRAAVEITRVNDLPLQRVLCTNNLAAVLQEQGRFEEALEVQDTLLELVRGLGIGAYPAMFLNNRALTRLHLGDLREAEADLIAARTHTLSTDKLCLVEMNTAALEALRGRFERVVTHAESSLAMHGEGVMAAAALLWAALGEVRLGRLDAARGRLAQVDAIERAGLPNFLSAAFVPVRAALYREEARAGDAEAAERAARAEAAIDRSIPLVALVARAAL